MVNVIDDIHTKRCPFCQSDRNRVERWDVTDIPPRGHTEYAVMCENCGCFGPNAMSPSHALDMWNLRRTDDVACSQMVEEQER